jgi:hypothetical protein
MATAPNSVNYSNQLPLGIEAKSQRRLFFPSTGDAYSSDGSSIIRISLNYDGMLDTSQSYLKFDIKNNTTASAGDGSLVKDIGQPEIERLVISSGGVVLEDIQEYNTLLGAILVPCQGNPAIVNDNCINFNAFNSGASDQTSSAVQYKYATAVASSDASNDADQTGNPVIATGNTKTCCYKLVSGLLDNEKYLPLVLMNNGLDIEIHLATGNKIGCSGLKADRTADDISYAISNPRYVAHLVDLQRDFYDMLRMTQQQSGGVIQIAGQTFRHFSNSLPKGSTGAKSFNIPVRARSIKSILFVHSRNVATNNSFQFYSSTGGLLDYQVQIGATKFPPTSIAVNNDTNRGEPYYELMKSFGKLGSNIHSNLLSSVNYLKKDDISVSAKVATSGTIMCFAPYGLDLETFRAEIENGVDTSSRALPMTLLANYTAGGTGGGNVDLTLHSYALIDSLFFINMDGSVSVSA